MQVNEQPWEPPQGFVKRRCEDCTLWYAKPLGGRYDCCADCLLSRGIITAPQGFVR